MEWEFSTYDVERGSTETPYDDATADESNKKKTQSIPK
jgi:hypothetical protein